MTVNLADLAEQAEKIARIAREMADREAERDAFMAGFQRHSAARYAASVLLGSEGLWLSRTEIAAASGCRPNAVVAVVDRLRRNGVQVERRTLDGHAMFRVVPAGEGAA
jgi:biotin operon repressor